MAVTDVSFISLRKVLPNLVSLLDADDGQLVALVKPQFEVGKGRVGKRGVVRDPLLHREVLEASADGCVEAGLIVCGLTFSPIKGPEGNIEFWIWAARRGVPAHDSVESVVEMAHLKLGG